MKNKNVKLVNAHTNPRKPGFVYAELIDAVTGELIIAATLGYIETAIIERGYKLNR